MVEKIGANLGKINKILDNISASSSQDQMKESFKKFLDLSNRHILSLLLAIEGLETGRVIECVVCGHVTDFCL